MSLHNGFTAEDYTSTNWVEGEGVYQFVVDEDCDPDHDLWVYHRSGAIKKAVAPRDWFNNFEEWMPYWVKLVCENEGWDTKDVVCTKVQG